MSVGILGSGFGLYGYLPCIILGFDQQVVLPSRYRTSLQERRDVGHLAAKVDWVADDVAVMERVRTLIVSRRPADQVTCVARALDFPNISNFILEKPVAPEPAQAIELLDRLEQRPGRVRIGFTFRHTGWARSLAAWQAQADQSSSLKFIWRFRAHHYATNLQTWKRRPSEGGGALRFYGIHLVALLAEHGYTGVKESVVRGAAADDAAIWEAILTGPGRPECRIQLDSNADDTSFEVRGASRQALENLDVVLADPFDAEPSQGAIDRRVEPLMQLYRSLQCDPVHMPPWYRSSVELWRAIESATGA